MAGPSFRAAPVRVRVPATSANLGPGFDALGLSLALYDDVVVRIADSGLHVDVAGEGADEVDRGRRNLVVRALRAAFDRLGGLVAVRWLAFGLAGLVFAYSVLWFLATARLRRPVTGMSMPDRKPAEMHEGAS